MGLFKKHEDPISDRARALNAQIAALESKIQKLSTTGGSGENGRPPASALANAAQSENPKRGSEPIFEAVDQRPLQAPAESLTSRQHFNELGVRKYDLPGLIERVKKQFSSPPTSNPKLVNYLATGSVQGLRTLRYEKRIARNRFLLVFSILLLVIVGILAKVLGH